MSWYFITSLSSSEKNCLHGIHDDAMDNHNPKWTLTAMEKYMREHGDSNVALGLLPAATKGSRRAKPHMTVPHHEVAPHPPYGDPESAGEESSPSWGSSSTGNTPSYGSGGVTFEFSSKADELTTSTVTSAAPPVITTTSCTPGSTPENSASSRKISEGALSICLSSDLLAALEDSDDPEELCHEEAVKKGNENLSVSSGGQSGNVTVIRSQHGTPTKFRTLSCFLRRTQSAGSSKDALFIKTPVTKTKSADSASCDREDGDEKDRKKRKSLAQDVKMKLSFLRRRHTDSSLHPSVRPSQKEAHKWAESFHDLTNSKYGLCLFRAFLSREFCEENIEFWLACEEFKRSKPSNLSSKAQKIYDEFVAVESPKQVNLDTTIRTIIEKSLQNPEKRIFDAAQRRIQGLMEQDSYVRFLHSDLYTDLAKGHKS